VRGIPMELWVVVLNPTSHPTFGLLLGPLRVEMPGAIKAMPMEGVRAWTQRGGTTGITAVVALVRHGPSRHGRRHGASSGVE